MSDLVPNDPLPASVGHAEGSGANDADKIGELIRRLQCGESAALDELLPLVYSQLRLVARRLRRRENLGSPTWNTTAVVNEAYLKLAQANSQFGDRVHFFAVASTAMRQLLIDEARKRSRHKRGSGQKPLSLEGLREASTEDQRFFLLELDDAINRISKDQPRLARVVECRYFGGMTEEETAEALACSVRTVRRDWTLARARLGAQFGTGTMDQGPS